MGQGQSTNNALVTTHYEENYPFKIVKCKYEWTVENFKDLTLSTGSFNTSQRLKVDVNGQTDEWEIVFYPKGFNERTANYISVWLKKISNSERLVQFTCQVSRANNLGKDLVKKTIKKKLALETYLGWSTFCKRSHILKNESEVLRNGSLVLICNLEIYDDKCISHADLEDEDPEMDVRLAELSCNFKELLQNHKHYDVTFEIEKKTLFAHKAVLATRSPVFRAMFDSHLEKKNKIIHVTDISRDTFAAMLLFIYSGECVEKEFEAVFKLYYASDKYELLNLRNICTMILIDSLNIENSIKIANLANKHSDMILQDSAVDFISKNSTEIQKRKEWLDLMRDFPYLANAVFERLTYRKSNF